MNSLGIYFGHKVISIVETQGKRLLHNTEIPYSILSAGESLEEKVPTELKIATVFKDELSRNKIETKEATVSLSGKDLVVRTFDMLIVPRDELHGAVNFEAKKYIPFKIEDLVSDYQVVFDKSSHRNLILFIGIKKETLNKYLAILNQVNIKANKIEYSAFGVLRLMYLSGLSQKGIIGVISADFKERDEANFMVLENGFPLFSRDITLVGGPEELFKPETVDTGAILDKLKTEMRISLDFYHRKFPSKNIVKIFFVTSGEHRQELATFITDMGLSAQFIDVSKYIGKPVAFSLSFIKGYCSSLSKVIKTKLKINLLQPKAKPRFTKEVAISKGAVSLLSGAKIDPKIIILGSMICLAAFLFALYQKMPLQKELAEVKAKRPPVFTVNPEARYEELIRVDSEYKKKTETMDKLVKQQMYITEQLNIIPRVIPQDMWLTSFSSQKKADRADLILKGIALLGDSNKELEAINTFITFLKEDPTFGKYFREITIVSISNEEIGKIIATNFVISCVAK